MKPLKPLVIWTLVSIAVFALNFFLQDPLGLISFMGVATFSYGIYLYGGKEVAGTPLTLADIPIGAWFIVNEVYESKKVGPVLLHISFKLLAQPEKIIYVTQKEQEEFYFKKDYYHVIQKEGDKLRLKISPLG